LEIIELLLICLALSAGSFATLFKNELDFEYRILGVAVTFAFISGVSVLLGYVSGFLLSPLVKEYIEILSAALILLLGVKTLMNTINQEKSDAFIIEKPGQVLILGVASGVNAILAGMSLGMLKRELTPIMIAVFSLTFLSALSALILKQNKNGVKLLRTGIIFSLIFIGVGVKMFLEIFGVIG
jgi:putative Mn2+ efflux pump MntP